MYNHVVTALLLEVVGEVAPLNETAEGEERTSPRYARHRFLRGFRVSLRWSCTGWSGSR
ncbi:hypothetical protein MetMK1DRAFT_00008050 [Metallosphaera yellowstonensis MK1]|uniref:Uncharacterized protein n=1 Tax=Metallosphaera yellowstonensis MK1 TaxID=671065 RepID=H2C232_9CREN|nr:hypothetical protein MetMK1DRAFT_00008050 [Metallosphaera yellowstonensis MK1]